jgi:hypothetical protein
MIPIRLHLHNEGIDRTGGGEMSDEKEGGGELTVVGSRDRRVT